MQPPPIAAGAHKPAGHRAGVLGVLEKQSSGDGAVAQPSRDADPLVRAWVAFSVASSSSNYHRAAGSIAGHEDQGPRAGRLVHEVFTAENIL
jgi:hypothetical protein